MNHVTFKRDGKTQAVSGRVLVAAQDGGLLVQSRDGMLWTILPEEQIDRAADDVPFKPYEADELAERTLAELPSDFRVHKTAHYLIFYDTSSAYAQWCGSLFERLYLAFTNYWRRKGFDIREPEFPLSAIVFADRRSYLKFSRPELGEAAESVVGYYALLTNRMTMYDLTGVEAAGLNDGRERSSAQINRVLSQPNAQGAVATIVHEATHQIAFNCGLHTRLSDCPLWFSEGIAVYFETPDLSSAKGWRGIGAVNRPRLQRFYRYLPSRPADSLETLIREDGRFRDVERNLDAYAETWALTYFLIRQRPKQYVAYLAMLSTKKPLLHDSPDERIEQFREIFGDLKQLDAEFLRYMTRSR
ncbi:MAG: DUF1570 domain-containing protein [Pirellulales bacterium]|nr:DUF1570 domain-containing protein [Pirellulales bacterium]